jgi:hypothetical protein
VATNAPAGCEQARRRSPAANEPLTVDQEVGGSSPPSCTSEINKLSVWPLRPRIIVSALCPQLQCRCILGLSFVPLAGRPRNQALGCRNNRRQTSRSLTTSGQLVVGLLHDVSGLGEASFGVWLLGRTIAVVKINKRAPSTASRSATHFGIRDVRCAGLEPSRSDLRSRASAIQTAARISSSRGGEPLVAT